MVYPNPQIYPSLKAIFVHVPKTAGTSIERALLLGEKRVVGGHTTARGYRATFKEEFKSYFKFSLVRDPVDRFASAFYYLRQCQIHPALNNQAAHECDTVDEFVDRVEKDPHLIDKIIHLWPQHNFICDESNQVIVDEVYYYEGLTEAWSGILDKIKVPHFELPFINISKRPKSLNASQKMIGFVHEYYSTDYKVFNFNHLKK